MKINILSPFGLKTTFMNVFFCGTISSVATSYWFPITRAKYGQVGKFFKESGVTSHFRNILMQILEIFRNRVRKCSQKAPEGKVQYTQLLPNITMIFNLA